MNDIWNITSSLMIINDTRVWKLMLGIDPGDKPLRDARDIHRLIIDTCKKDLGGEIPRVIRREV